MCQMVFNEAAFYRLLLRVDEDLAAAERTQRCRVCGKALHGADYWRKPRGVPARLGERYRRRFSFCCANRECRKRCTPGAKVYLSAVVVLIAAMRCGATPARMRYLHDLVGVSRHTVMRWQRWWREMLPETRSWRGAAGTLMPPVVVEELPASLLERFASTCAERLLSLLHWLSPISTRSPAVHAA